MARIGGTSRAPENSINALAQGEAIRQRQVEADRANANQQRAEIAQSTRDFANFQQAEEQKRATRAREDLDNRQLAEVQRRNRMGEAMDQDRLDVEMADRGLERTGQSRADRVAAEMARGGEQQQQAQPSPDDMRRQAQMDQPLEVPGSDRPTVAPTAERTAQEGSKLATDRMNAQANYLNALRNYNEARIKGDVDGMKAELENLQQPIKSAAKMFDAGRKQELTDSQWNNIKQLAEDNPDPALQQEIDAQEFGPRVGQFLQARVSESAMQFMALTGDMPDGNLVDMASPVMQQFTRSAGELQQYLKAADLGGMLSSALGIRSLADKNRVVRKLTARAMLHQMANPAKAGKPVIPSQGGANALQQPGQPPTGQPGAGPQQQQPAGPLPPPTEPWAGSPPQSLDEAGWARRARGRYPR